MTENIELTDEMIAYHNERINRHITTVQDLLKSCFSKAMDATCYSAVLAAKHNSIEHDRDKMVGGDNWESYVLIDWAYKEWKNGRKFPYNDLMRAGTKKHCSVNKHHPECWDPRYVDTPELFNTEEREENPEIKINATAMTDTYIAEMIADWKATAIERGNLASTYYNKVIKRTIIFTKDQQYLIEQLLDVFEG